MIYVQRLAAIISLLVVVPASFAFDVAKYVSDGVLAGSFSGPNGWRGHIIENSQAIKVLIWQAPDGLVVFGKLLDANARDLTTIAQQKYATHPLAVSVLPLSESERHDEKQNTERMVLKAPEVYQRLEALNASHYTAQRVSAKEQDHALPYIYVFYDFQCPYCAAAFEFMEQIEQPLEIRWVPVSIVHPTSAYLGAGVLDGDWSLKSLGQMQKRRSRASSSLDRVQTNTALLKSLQPRAAVPTFVFDTTQFGIPEQLNRLLSKDLDAHKESHGIRALSGFDEDNQAILQHLFGE